MPSCRVWCARWSITAWHRRRGDYIAQGSGTSDNFAGDTAASLHQQAKTRCCTTWSHETARPIGTSSASVHVHRQKPAHMETVPYRYHGLAAGVSGNTGIHAARCGTVAEATAPTDNHTAPPRGEAVHSALVPGPLGSTMHLGRVHCGVLGALRSSEYLCRGGGEHRGLRHGDITWEDEAGGCRLPLRIPIARQFGPAAFVLLSGTGTSTCPMRALRQFVTGREAPKSSCV